MFKRILGFALIALFSVGCNSASISPTTAPAQPRPTDVGVKVDTPAPDETPTLDYTNLSFPTMTALAETELAATWQALGGTPTSEPSDTPEAPNAQNIISTSPNGNFIIACFNTGLGLFESQTNKLISQNFDFPFRGCDSEFRWAADSSYAVAAGWNMVMLTDETLGKLKGNQIIGRWSTDGSQPQLLEIHFDKEPMYAGGLSCENPASAWSADGQHLAVIIGCYAYLVSPFAESGFGTAKLITEHTGALTSFRSLYPHIMLVESERGVSFMQIPTGKGLSGFSKFCSACCTSQLPNFSPDVQWIVDEACWAGGGEQQPDEYYIINTLDTSQRIFSNTFNDRIEFIGWKADSSEFLIISRPMTDIAQADPRTPFGLLALDPQTLETRMLFPQAWFAAFNKDMTWAFIAFPAKNPDGSLRLDGGLWKIGSTELLGRQTLSPSLQDNYLYPWRTITPMYMPSGEYVGEGDPTTSHPLPAAWSHAQARVAVINAAQGLVFIDMQGNVKKIGLLPAGTSWNNSEIIWAADDKSVVINGVTYAIP